MQEKDLFEYAIIRVVPRVEREEFLNVGVILYCPRQSFLETRYVVNTERLKALCAKIDIEEIRARLDAFDRICKGHADSGEIGKLPVASRFRWLTANRSTIVQTSPVHPGLSCKAGETVQKLFEQFVL